MIGWVLLSREAVARAEEALSSNEKGVRDEVGFLALHQGFADRFFPGTSVLHTRLRYVLFVPWLMEKVAADAATDIARRLSDAETALAGQLKAGPGHDPDGIIGGQVHPRKTAQPPSMTYWSALGSWGILRRQSDGSLPSRTQTLRRLSRRSARLKSRLTDDDGGALNDDATSPFVSLPKVPKAIRVPGEPLDFALSPDERTFLHRHLLGVRRPGTTSLSLLARLAKVGVGPAADDLWGTEIAHVADPEDRTALVIARQAAALAGIGRGVYAALVELARTNDGLPETTRHQDHLEEMMQLHGHDAGNIDLNALSGFLPDLPEDLSGVLSETRAWVAVGDPDPSALSETYSRAERNRKGLRARLPDTVAGRQRRAEWDPDEYRRAEPLHYRWPNVRRLLTDLQAA